MQTATTIDGFWASQSRPHTFQRTVTVSRPFTTGSFPLYFYHPKSYASDKTSHGYPVVLSFHGGGFTIGDARDDVKWINLVADELDAIVVSVGYRKAPEFPYPTAVQDGAWALGYLAEHASELGVDTTRVVISGFSSGGNLSLAVPMLYSVLRDEAAIAKLASAHRSAIPTGFDIKTTALGKYSRCSIVAIASFYPTVDYTLSRPQRRATNPEPSQNLSQNLYSLFDFSYLPIRAEEEPSSPILKDPFLSPSQASSDFLKTHLPKDIIILTCEFDMLQKEGEELIGKMAAAGINSKHFKIEKVAHGWDKVPAILRRGEAATWGTQQVGVAYAEACSMLKEVLISMS